MVEVVREKGPFEDIVLEGWEVFRLQASGNSASWLGEETD